MYWHLQNGKPEVNESSLFMENSEAIEKVLSAVREMLKPEKEEFPSGSGNGSTKNIKGAINNMGWVAGGSENGSIMI